MKWYVRDRVPPESLIAVAVHRMDADLVLSDFLADFQRLDIPLYDYEGELLGRRRKQRGDCDRTAGDMHRCQ